MEHFKETDRYPDVLIRLQEKVDETLKKGNYNIWLPGITPPRDVPTDSANNNNFAKN